MSTFYGLPVRYVAPVVLLLFAGAVAPVLGQCVDLSLTLEDSPDPVEPNATLTYTLTVENLSTDTDATVTVLDILPVEVSVLSTQVSAASAVFADGFETGGLDAWQTSTAFAELVADPEALIGCTAGSGLVSCDVGILSAGSTVTVTIKVEAPSTATTIYNTANVNSSDRIDCEESNNSAAETTTVESAADEVDLSLEICGNLDPVAPGETHFVYTLCIDNVGTSDATGVILESYLPPELSASSIVPTQGNCQSEWPPTCELGDIDSGNSAVVTLTTTVSAQASGALTHPALVVSDQVDGEFSDNDFTLTTDIGTPSVVSSSSCGCS